MEDERRLIHCGLFYSNRSSCAVLGQIEHLDSESVRIDARTREIAGQHYGLALKFSDVIRFQVVEAIEPRQYEDFILAELPGGCTCEIHATKLLSNPMATLATFPPTTPKPPL